MNQIPKLFLLLALPVFLAGSLFTVVKGQTSGGGEVTGKVYESWAKDNRVVFRMNIASQKSVSGIGLDTPNVFAYAGEDRHRITDGDVLKLDYDASDSDGIIANRIEFIEDRQGTIGQTKTLSIIITLAGFLFGILLLIGGIIYQKRRMRPSQAQN